MPRAYARSTRKRHPSHAATHRTGANATAGDELRLRTTSYGDRWIVELAGRLDDSRCDLLGEALEQAIDAAVEEIVLDLTEVVAIDRAAVRAILLAHLRASDQRAQLVIVPGRRSVQEALEAIEGPFMYADPPEGGGTG